MRAPIAKIRISAGNPGWYDSLTGIHLTITKPEAFVYEGQNVSNIKTGVAYKLIYVVEGELDGPAKEIPTVKESVREVIKQPVAKTVEKIEVVEEVKKPAEETTEKVVEEKTEVVEEKKKTTKRSTKKKTTAVKEEESK